MGKVLIALFYLTRARARVMRGDVSAPSTSLHYQSVVDVSSGVTSTDSGDELNPVAEGFFDLANAAVVKYSVGTGSHSSDLLVEQDQSLHDSCGGIVWESAFCLSQYLERNAGTLVKGKNVLELGAGAGLVGMVCKRLGAKKVTLTDHPNAMPLLRRNIERNFKGNDDDKNDNDVTYLPLDWTDSTQLKAVTENGPYELVVATDVVFAKELVQPMMNCIQKACESSRNPVILIALQERCPDAFAHFKAVSKQSYGNGYKEIPKSEVKFVDDACVLFELRRNNDEKSKRKKRKSNADDPIETSKSRKKDKREKKEKR